jgi:hypothetical protein
MTSNLPEQFQGGINEMTSIEEKLIGRISAQLTRAVEEADQAYEFAPGSYANRARAAARAADIAPVIADLRAAGTTSLQAIADGLNERSIPTARGGQWSATQVMRVLART